MWCRWRREWVTYAFNLDCYDFAFFIFLVLSGVVCGGFIAVLVLILVVSPNDFNNYNFFKRLEVVDC